MKRSSEVKVQDLDHQVNLRRSARQKLEEPAPSTRSQKPKGRWTSEEKRKFEEGLRLFGRNWKKIKEHVGTRSGTQIRSHAQKYILKLDACETANEPEAQSQE